MASEEAPPFSSVRGDLEQSGRTDAVSIDEALDAFQDRLPGVFWRAPKSGVSARLDDAASAGRSYGCPFGSGGNGRLT